MSTIKKVIEDSLKELKETFKCIEYGCDGNGTCPDSDGGPMQCQYCFEVRFPFFEKLSTTISNVLEAVEKEVIEKAWDESGKGDSLITVADIQSLLKSAKEGIK